MGYLQPVVFPVLFVLVSSFDRSFQQHSHVVEARVGEEGTQAFFADDTLAQTSMHVAVTAQRFLGIVEVQNLEAGQTDYLVEVLQDVQR